MKLITCLRLYKKRELWVLVSSKTYFLFLLLERAFQAAQVVKNPPSSADTEEEQVQSPGQEDPLEEGMASCSRILAWRIPLRGVWWAPAHRVPRSQTQLKHFSTHACTLGHRVANKQKLRKTLTPMSSLQKKLVFNLLIGNISNFIKIKCVTTYHILAVSYVPNILY